MGGPGSGPHKNGGGKGHSTSAYNKVKEDIKSHKGQHVNYSSPAFLKMARKQKRDAK